MDNDRPAQPLYANMSLVELYEVLEQRKHDMEHAKACVAFGAQASSMRIRQATLRRSRLRI